MKQVIKVPVMGESVSQATIGSFLIESGGYVVAGQEILELETDKVNQALYAEASGKISWKVAPGAIVQVGDVLGEIDLQDQQEVVKPVEVPEIKKTEGSARKHVDEFLSSPEQPPPVVLKQEPQEESRKKMSGLRKTIASRLVEVKNKTAMLTTFNEVDMSAVMQIRNQEKETFQKKYGVKLGFMSFFVKAVVSALKQYPIVHARIEGEEVVTPSAYDIGVAVSTDKGLFVPVIKNCEHLSFSEIEQSIGNFAEKARTGTIAVEDLKGGSFTITNGGVFGSLLSTPIINPPQSAILGVHAIVERPIAVQKQVVIRPMMYLAVSYDHRLIDGKEAVSFLVHIKTSLEDPSRLLLDL